MILLSQAAAPLSDAEFQRFREFFYRRTGISFAPDKHYYIEKRLHDRFAQTGAENFAQYFARLLEPEAAGEIEQLINALPINETFFYREAYQFAALAEELLPEIAAARPQGGRIRILSLPCATGEEPYSIALYLMEHWPGIAQYDVELLAGDIDTAALAKARAGIYDSHTLRRLPREVVGRYFTQLAADKFQLAEFVRQAVHFAQVNVTSAADMRRYRDIDVIFCRNMLIYFDDAARRRTVEAFYESLVPGGFICLGHSESMGRISAAFAVRPSARGVVYQKPGILP